MAVARITGTVLSTDRRQGTSDRTGKAYDFTEVKVLVAEHDVATFTARGNDGAHFNRGDIVDVLVEQDVYGQRLSSTLIGQWPMPDAA